jgi:HlyD family secretion protein
MRKIVIAGGVVLALGGAVALWSTTHGTKDPEWKTVAVTRGGVTEKALAIGAIRPRREIAVKSKISGIVKRTFREVGDHVNAGDPLFEILPDPTPMELTEARREVEIARNSHDEARKRNDRTAALGEQGILSNQEADKATKDVQEARIRLSLATEKLALIEKGRVKTDRLDVESIIRAPVSGTVLELLVHEGDPVVPLTSYQEGTALTNLADMSDLIFKGTVDEIDVGKLHEGMPARIKVGALPDAQVDGKVHKIAPKSKTAEGATLFDVEIALLPAPGTVLRAGYSANADVVVREKKDVLVVPERLVTMADGKATVEVPGLPGAEPTKKDVKVGLSDGMSVEITSGLQEKDLVVERPPRKIE